MSAEQAIERAKLALGFGDLDGWAQPCEVAGCGSRVSRQNGERWECWNHYTGPLQLELAA